MVDSHSVYGQAFGVFLRTGLYYYTTAVQATSTLLLTNSQVRAAPFYVPRSLTLTRIGIEVTTAGDVGRSGAADTHSNTTLDAFSNTFVATDVGRRVTGTGIPADTYITTFGSSTSVTMSQPATATASGITATLSGAVVRLGIYNDDTTGYPGTVLLDAGTIDGSTTNAGAGQEITISQPVTPGLYWVAAVAQGVTTTAPTVRSNSGGMFSIGSSTVMTSSLTVQAAYLHASVTSALPTFTASPSPGGSSARTFVKIA